MATKTYLELVNDVLIRLRESTVGAVSYSSYSALIGKWINDAKRLVEDAWDWQALQTTIPVSIAPSVLTYNLSTLNERARLLRNVQRPSLPLAFDTTAGTNFQLQDVPFDWIREQLALQTVVNTQAKPSVFGLVRRPGTIDVYLYETPSAVRSWTLYFVDPQDDLSADGDILNVPYAPVILIALDTALNERGEEIGEPGSTVEQRANMHIANAIAIDAQDQPHKTTFFPG